MVVGWTVKRESEFGGFSRQGTRPDNAALGFHFGVSCDSLNAPRGQIRASKLGFRLTSQPLRQANFI